MQVQSHFQDNSFDKLQTNIFITTLLKTKTRFQVSNEYKNFVPHCPEALRYANEYTKPKN